MNEEDIIKLDDILTNGVIKTPGTRYYSIQQKFHHSIQQTIHLLEQNTNTIYTHKHVRNAIQEYTRHVENTQLTNREYAAYNRTKVYINKYFKHKKLPFRLPTSHYTTAIPRTTHTSSTADRKER